MMTLKELRKMVTVKTSEKTLSEKALKLMDVEIVAKETVADGCDVTVYKNGHVVYKADGRKTVFKLPKEENYAYDSVANGQMIGSEFFENEPWYTRLILEGEDRLSANQINKESHRGEIHYGGIDELYGLNGNGTVASCEQMICDMDTVHEMLALIPKRQADVVYCVCVQNMTQKEAAEFCGIAPQTAHSLLHTGLANLKKALEKK